MDAALNTLLPTTGHCVSSQLAMDKDHFYVGRTGQKSVSVLINAVSIYGHLVQTCVWNNFVSTMPFFYMSKSEDKAVNLLMILTQSKIGADFGIHPYSRLTHLSSSHKS